MSRLARAVFPGLPHHVTQRGNGRARTFFSDDDYRLYRDFLAGYTTAAGVEVWTWVLVPNHVHLILVPHDTGDLRPAAEAGAELNALSPQFIALAIKELAA